MGLAGVDGAMYIHEPVEPLSGRYWHSEGAMAEDEIYFVCTFRWVKQHRWRDDVEHFRRSAGGAGSIPAWH